MTQSNSDFTRTRAGTAELTESERHRLLTVKRRRVALDILAGWTPAVDLADLAAAVAAREAGVDSADGETVERVTIDLHHAHLPMMDTFGIIDYDPDANRVESCPSRSDSPTE